MKKERPLSTAEKEFPRCGRKAKEFPPGWRVMRRPICGRPAGHKGDHI